MHRIFSIIFSPTGGTQRVADRLCEALGQDRQSIDLCDRFRNTESVSFAPGDICVVAVPSFAGRVPAAAAERLQKLIGNGAMAVPVAVYGNRAYEDTLLEMKHILTGQGFRCIAAVAAIAEHSMLRQYAAGRPDAQDMAELDLFAGKIMNAVRSDSISCDLPVPGNFPYRDIGAFLKPETTETCIRCGVCADMCPAGAIPMDEPSATDLNRCISCVRCISICPMQARRLNPAMLEAVNTRIGNALSGRKSNDLFL